MVVPWSVTCAIDRVASILWIADVRQILPSGIAQVVQYSSIVRGLRTAAPWMQA